MIQRFYSNGKLLISAEYLVLDGVKALALPTRFGQDLCVKPISESVLCWNGFDVDGTKWISETIEVKRIIANERSDKDSTFLKTLLSVLHKAHIMNPNILDGKKGYEVETRLTFPRLWGLGTSSTWINNVAQWFQINAFDLLEASFGGSGYDIACAQENTPITYRKTLHQPKIVPVIFNPVFSDDLYFVYLNQKKSSKEAIENYRTKKNKLQSQYKEIESITDQMLEAKSLLEFQGLMRNHEAILDDILESETIQKRLFSDFDGAIKSLGAWGGDFVLVASQDNPKEYFKERGYSIILTYQEMILDKTVE